MYLSMIFPLCLSRPHRYSAVNLGSFSNHIDKPNVEVWTDPSNYKTGVEVQLICSAEGNPKPDVVWVFEKSIPSAGVNVTNGTGLTSATSVLSPGGINGSESKADGHVTTAVYKINQLTEQHSGIYTCSAMNEEGNDTKSITLRFEAKGDLFHSVLNFYLMATIRIY